MIPTGSLLAVMPAVNSVTVPGGRDPADLVAGRLGEPEVAVRARP